MDATYVQFAGIDPVFYDHPSRRRIARSSAFAPASGCDWSSWAHLVNEHWSHWSPEGVELPEQGWKIHASATPESAGVLLSEISAYCHRKRLPFKHLRDRNTHAEVDGKAADRASAGKFITIFPPDDSILEATLIDLDGLVGGTPGPYVLSDLRWNNGPLSVRYGGFAALWTRGEEGTLVPAIRDPRGVLHEDRRTSAFLVPGWVVVPDFLEAQRAALGSLNPPEAFPYLITRALHHSNAGGVYEATDRTGTRVILKEARPLTGRTPDGRDAVTRLCDEERWLREVAGSNVVPVRDALTLHDHRFLVLEHLEGSTLAAQVVARSPLIRTTSTAAEMRAYRDWAIATTARMRDAVTRIHAAGRVHGDLHPGNVIVGADGRVTLIDLEMSSAISEPAAMHMGAPGFVPPDGRIGVSSDLYALACLDLFVFVPLTTLFPLDPAKADEHLAFACAAFGLDEDWAARVRGDLDLAQVPQASRLAARVDEVIRAWRAREEDGDLGVQVMIGRGLEAAADFSRVDRAWPGDPLQFREGGFGLAHGAAGVIHALAVSGLDIDPLALEWLEDAIDVTLGAQAAPRVGLYDGLAGAGWLLRRLGRHDTAERVLACVLDRGLDGMGDDLYGGLAGVGIYLLSEADERPVLMDEVERIAVHLRAALDLQAAPAATHRPSSVTAGRGGLMWGPSGTAAFAARLYAATGESAHLALATDAVDRDLASCAAASDGSWQVNEGWRLMPYLATGSAGIGLVLADLVRHLPESDRYLSALDGIRAAASVPFTIEPGLFYGRAGMIHLLTVLARAGLSTPAADAALDAHVDALQLHAIRYRQGIGFPGRGLLRLSCDLATGSAGVLTALQSYALLAHDEARPGWEGMLPLIGPIRSPRGASRRPQLQGGR